MFAKNFMLTESTKRYTTVQPTQQYTSILHSFILKWKIAFTQTLMSMQRLWRLQHGCTLCDKATFTETTDNKPNFYTDDYAGVSPDRTSKQWVTFVKGFFLGSGVIYATPWLLIGQGLQRYVEPPSPHIPSSPFTHPSYLLNAWSIWVCRAQASLKGFERTDC